MQLHILGKEDCYYQYVQPGATFYASMQVIPALLRIHLLHLFVSTWILFSLAQSESSDCVLVFR